jgi:hypothetical protein
MGNNPLLMFCYQGSLLLAQYGICSHDKLDTLLYGYILSTVTSSYPRYCTAGTEPSCALMFQHLASIVTSASYATTFFLLCFSQTLKFLLHRHCMVVILSFSFTQPPHKAFLNLRYKSLSPRQMLNRVIYCRALLSTQYQSAQ